MLPKKESLAKRKAAAAQVPNERSEPSAPKPNEQNASNASVDNGTTKSVMNLHGIPPVLPDNIYIHPNIIPPFADVQVLRHPPTTLMVGSSNIRSNGQIFLVCVLCIFPLHV